MARRRSRGIDYVAVPTDTPDLSVMLVKDSPVPDLNPSHLAALQRLLYLGWRLWIARKDKKNSELRESNLKSQINQILDDMPEGIHGVRGHIGQRSSVRLLRSLVIGREPVNARRWINYLGEHTETVITSLDLPLDKITGDAGRFAEFLDAVSLIYGTVIADMVKLSINQERLEKLQDLGQLPEEPAGLWAETTSHTRLTVEPVAAYFGI